MFCNIQISLKYTQIISAWLLQGKGWVQMVSVYISVWILQNILRTGCMDVQTQPQSTVQCGITKVGAEKHKPNQFTLVSSQLLSKHSRIDILGLNQ